MLPQAAGRGQHFQVQSHSFSPYGPTLSRQITYLFVFVRRIGLQLGLHNFVIELVYVPPTNHRKNLTNSGELRNDSNFILEGVV